jgi:hypothetical protein
LSSVAKKDEVRAAEQAQSFCRVCRSYVDGPSSHAAANRVQAGTSTDGDQCVGTNLKEYELICVVFTGEAN